MGVPSISIIVPNYNHSFFLRRRIESILDQHYSDYEIILLDDASTDDSIEILKEYRGHPKVNHVVINKFNSGSPYKQWKKGLGLAKGRYIWIAESDDFAAPTLLEELFKLISNNEKVGIAYAQSYDIDGNDNVIKNRGYFTEEFSTNIWQHEFVMNGREFVESYMIHKNVISNASAALIKKEALEKYLEIDNNLELNTDWLTWIRILSAYDIAFTPKPLNYFRQHLGTVREREHKTSKPHYEAIQIMKVVKGNFQPEKKHFDKCTARMIRYWIACLVQTENSRYDFKFLVSAAKLRPLFTLVRIPKIIYAKTKKLLASKRRESEYNYNQA